MSHFSWRVPERCRSGAGAPPGQTGPWATRLGSSSPSWERQWGMSESPPVHQLHDKDKMQLLNQAIQHRASGCQVLLWKVELELPLKLPTWASSWTPVSPSSYKPILPGKSACLPLPHKHLLTGGRSRVPPSAAVWTPLTECCWGETSTILDRLHLHSLPSSLALNETSDLIQSPPNPSTPGLPSSYLTSSNNTHAPSQNLWTSTVDLVSTSRTSWRTFGDRSFSLTAPTLWESLPSDTHRPTPWTHPTQPTQPTCFSRLWPIVSKV